MPETPAFILTSYTAVYAVSFTIATIVAAVSWQRRKSTGGLALALLMAAASVWTFFGMLEVSATAQETKILFSKLEYIGGVSVPVLFLLFAADYTGLGKWLNRRTISAAFFIPAVTLILAATNEQHGLIWNSFSSGPAGSNLIIYGHGIWFWLSNIGYTSLCILAGGILLVRHALQTHQEYLPRTVLMLAGVAAPWLSGFIYVSGNNPFPGYDLTRVAFSFSGILFLFAIFHWQLLDILPVARNVIIDTIPDGMLVLDRRNRIIDMNRAAREMLGINSGEIISRPLETLATSAPWISNIGTIDESPSGFCLITQNGTDLEADVTQLMDGGGKANGRVVFLRNVTDRKRAEQALHHSEMLYRTLFENMLNGLAYCCMIFHDEVPSDFVYLNVNHAFYELTGLKDVVGKKVTEVIPGIAESNPELLEIYGRVAVTGNPEAFENYVETLDMWFNISVYSPETGYFVAVFDVVTERKRLEEKLRSAADDWENTFDSIRDAISIIDAEHQILRVNQAFADLVGLPINKISGRYCYEVIHGTGSAITGCPHVCTLHDCRQASAEFMEPTLGKFIEVTTSPIISDGKCAGTVHVIKDISERKKTEIALQDNEFRLRSLFNSMTEGVALHQLVMDERGQAVNYRIVDVNPKFEEILGLKKVQVIGKPATEAYGVTKPPYLEEYAGVALTGRPGHIQVHFTPMDRDFDISIAPWGENGFATIFTDVTERNRIWETKSQLAAIVEFSADALIGRDINGIITSWNQAAEKMLGYTADEMIGQSNTPLIPADIANETPGILKQIRESGQSKHWETTRRCKDGRIIDVSATLSPVKDITGRVTGFSTIARDITETKKAQESIKTALAEKELLLKEIHHRVKNNMQVISSLLKMQAQFVTDEQTRQMLKESQDRIKSMSLVYNKLYQSADLACISIKEYAKELVNNLVHAYSLSPGGYKLM